MAISFSCKCGRRFRVKEEHAGRKAKCPECGQQIQIPQQSEQPESGPAKTPPVLPKVVEKSESGSVPRRQVVESPEPIAVSVGPTDPSGNEPSAAQSRLVTVAWVFLTYATVVALLLLLSVTLSVIFKSINHSSMIAFGGLLAQLGLCLLGVTFVRNGSKAWRIVLIVLVVFYGLNVVGVALLAASVTAYLPRFLPFPLMGFMLVGGVGLALCGVMYCWSAEGRLPSIWAGGGSAGVYKAGARSVAGVAVVLALSIIPASGAVAGWRGFAREVLSKRNLMQIGLAVQVHAMNRNTLPAARGRSAMGQHPVSWRVRLLPNLDERDLYERYKQDEPWDSPHNLSLLPEMPEVYALPGTGSNHEGKTYYQVFVMTRDGEEYNSVFGRGDRNCRMRTLASADGTSNTALVVEAQKPVRWTKPEDLPYSSEEPLPKLGGHFRAGFSALMCDGSVRYVPPEVEESLLRSIITYNDGNLVAF